jgi:hypothetical protein
VLDQPATLWKVRRDTEEAACMARLMPYGIEVDIVRNGKVVLTRVFETDQEALGWAEGKRNARESEGWTVLPTELPSDQRPVA